MICWPTKKLSDLLEICNVGVWGKPAIKGKGLFVLRSTNMTNEGRLNFSDVAERKVDSNIKKFKLLDGDILVEKSGGGPDQPVGRVAYFVAPDDKVYTFANFIQRLRVKSNLIDGRFLFYRLLFLHKIGFTKRLQSQTTGIRNLKLSLYLKTEIPVPPIKIQKQIVERLDKIVRAQKLNEGLIQKANELFQSLLHKELNSTGKRWEVKKLGDFINPQYGYTAAAKDEGMYRFIRITDIDNTGELRNLDKKYVSLTTKDAQPYKLTNGDLLLARTGATFGKILYFKENEPAIFASFLIRLNPNTKIINPFFLWLFSRSRNYWKQANSLMTGSGQPQFNANKLKQIKISLPSLVIQKQVVANLSAIQEYKTQLFAQKSKLKELFDSVLAKSFGGE
ncbi:restriction endonuclease subunit S [Candidatus Falkowbacteria bacterium]|nr:restriction endonuclease subunit S [Candidatus Falkowbacteria bacterium]